MVSAEEFRDIDIMVYIDEDCFITDTDALQELIDYSIENKFDCVGMPDGGVVKTRSHNPVSINMFFCILNLKAIREKYNLQVISQTKHEQELEKYTPFELIRGKYNYDNFEPYYRFFLWMVKNNYKFLYLDARSHREDDPSTTVLKTHRGREFAYHTWYARRWPEKEQGERIRQVIAHCRALQSSL